MAMAVIPGRRRAFGRATRPDEREKVCIRTICAQRPALSKSKPANAASVAFQ